jgi:hypothetical protein
MMGEMEAPQGDTLVMPNEGMGGNLGGSLGSLGGSLGTDLGRPDIMMAVPAASDEKVTALGATVEDIKGQVETLQMQGKSLKSDIEQIKGDLGSINDSMRSLLQVYEAVSREYNPFVDNSTTKKANEAKAEAKLEAKAVPKIETLSELDDEAADMLLRPEDNFEAVPVSAIKPKTPIKLEPVKPIPAPREVLPFVPEPKPEAKAPSKHEDTFTHPVAVSDPYIMNQVVKIVEFQMDRFYGKKQKGQKVSDQEYEEIEHWFKELRRLEVN